MAAISGKPEFTAGMTGREYLDTALRYYWGAGLDQHSTVFEEMTAQGFFYGHMANLDESLDADVDGNSKQLYEDTVAGYIKKHGWADKFKSVVGKTQSKLKTYLEQSGYDHAYWTDDKILETIRDKWEVNMDEGAMDFDGLNKDVQQVIINDTTQKIDDGYLDEDGNVIGEEAQLETSQQVDSLFSKYKLDKTENQALYDHLQEGIKRGEIDAYGAQQILKADPEYIQQESERIFKEFDPILQERLTKELDIIDRAGAKARGENEKVFREDISPTIRKEVGLLGGRGREYSAQSLAEEAGKMEERRESTLQDLRLEAEYADNERRAQLKAAPGQAQLNALGGAGTYDATASAANAKLKQYEKLNSAFTNTSNAMSRFAQNQQNKQMVKIAAQARKEQERATRAASKKASRLGMAANVFQGIVSGASTGGKMGGPWGAAIGGLVGGGAGFAQSDINRRAGGAGPSIGSYKNITAGAFGIANAFRGNNNNSSGSSNRLFYNEYSRTGRWQQDHRDYTGGNY